MPFMCVHMARMLRARELHVWICCQSLCLLCPSLLSASAYWQRCARWSRDSAMAPSLSEFQNISCVLLCMCTRVVSKSKSQILCLFLCRCGFRGQTWLS